MNAQAKLPADWRPLNNNLSRGHGFEPLRIEGRLPEGLHGTLYRNGPGLFELHGKRLRHAFEADGVISAVRFGGGAAQGAARVVETDGLKRERAAGRRLYGSGAPWLTRLYHQLKGESRNPANTSVLWHGGQLLALCEAGLPTVLHPETLETLGETTLDGALLGTFSAHPHRVNARRTTYNFGLRYGRVTTLDVYAMPDGEPVKRLCAIPLDAPVMLHDFIVTERHLVFFVSPAVVQVFKAMLALGDLASLFKWEPERGTEVIVVPIDAPDQPRRFTTEAFWCFHPVQGVSLANEQIQVDYVRYPKLNLNELAKETDDVSAESDAGRIHRATLNLAAGTLSSEELWDQGCEFPRVHPDREGGTAERIWTVWGAKEQGIARLDWREGRHRGWVPPSHWRCSEPVPVKRGPEEQDVWALTLIYDGHQQVSGVGVLDGERPEDGPVGVAWFDHAVPETYHGAWVG